MTRRFGVGRAAWGAVAVALALALGLLPAAVGGAPARERTGPVRSARAASGECSHPGASDKEYEAFQKNPADRANEHAAIQAAESLLATYVPPAGNLSLSASPVSGCGARGPDDEGTPAMVTGHHSWSVPGTPQAVLAAIEANPPLSGHPEISGSGCGANGCSYYVVYRSPITTKAISHASLSFAVRERSGGVTELGVYAAAVWIVPKPAVDLIPKTATVLELSVGRPYPAEAISSVTLTNAAKVARIVDAINKMPIVQPGIINCPEIPSDGSQATFTFLAGTGGAVVATAKMPAYTKTEGPCYGLRLELPAEGKTVGLENGEVVGLAEKVLGVPVYTPETRY